MHRRYIVAEQPRLTPMADEDYELLLPNQAGSAEPSEFKPQLVEENEGRAGDSVAMYSALIGAGLITAVSWISVIASNPAKLGWFALHAPLQTLALFLFTYGILTLQPTAKPKTKAAGLMRHQFAVLGIAFPAIFAGTAAIMINKYVHGAQHFKSLHARLGIMCMVWIVLQVMLGGGSVWFGGAAFGGGAKAKSVWKYHRVSGYILYLFLVLTVHLGGAWSNWAIHNTALVTRILAFGIGASACVLGVYSRLRPSKMKFY